MVAYRSNRFALSEAASFLHVLENKFKIAFGSDVKVVGAAGIFVVADDVDERA